MDLRDKGQIPLETPDAKHDVAVNGATGVLTALFVDVAHNMLCLWDAETQAFSQPQRFDPHITDWKLSIHDGQYKMTATTFKETSPDGKSHFVIFALGVAH